MNGSGKIVLILIIALALLAGAGFYYFMSGGIRIVLTPENLDNVAKGDLLYMNGNPIGVVTRTALPAPGKPEIHVRIYGEFAGHVNQTSVFTIMNDTVRNGKKAIEAKTCEPNGPIISKGHVFTPVNRLRYTVACLGDGNLMKKLWESPLRSLVMDSIKTGGKLSEEAMNRLKELEKSKHDEFQTLIDDIKRNIDAVTPELQKQLEQTFGITLPESGDGGGR